MEAIQELTQINYTALFISIFTALAGIKVACSLFEWVVSKLGLETKWMRQKREEHELLLRTSKNLSALQDKHQEDVKQSIAHDKRIQENLSTFITEIKVSMEETKKEQKELTDAIKSVTDADIYRDKQIDALTVANRELLADKINQKYQRYISLEGIPEDELEEFTSLHAAYNGVGGNHNGDAKYNYVIEHLRVIPVETKLINKND